MKKSEEQTPTETPSLVRAHEGEAKGRKILLGASSVSRLRKIMGDGPDEALLLRRMEGLLFQFASSLRAEAPWGALFRELVEGAEPATELGEQHAAWLAERA